MAEAPQFDIPAVTHTRQPRAGVIMTGGTQCQNETADVFRHEGANVRVIHMNDLLSGAENLQDLDMVIFAGGFAHGDHGGSGNILAQQIVRRLEDQLGSLKDRGGIMIGICNGAQALIKAGMITGGRREATLTYNDSGKFESRLVDLKVEPGTVCKFVNGIEVVTYQVAHGEGKFYAPDDVIQQLEAQGQIVMRYIGPQGNPTQEYPYNPNGSLGAVGAVCDETGRVLILMPHPERPNNKGFAGDIDLRLVRNAVEFAAGM